MKVVYSYKHVPTIKAFSLNDAFLRALIGPVGGGKTVGCFVEIVQRGMKQEPSPDGVRHTRFAAVRNTFKELEDTTMKTCLEWLPPSTFGNLVSSKHQYVINQLETQDGTPVEIEILFRALDRPDQLRDLLSLELTACYFNEMREIAKPIFDVMTTRVNRYPSKKDGGPGATWSGVFGDSNPCDTDHWMYVLFEEERPVFCSTCKTPRGEMVLYPTRLPDKSIIPLHERKCPQCSGDISKAIHLSQVFHQPSARGPLAENLPNLAQDYYSKLMVGKSPEFLRVYVDGEYGFMVDGRAVYSNWSQQIHMAAKDIEPLKGIPLIIGIDYGRNPAVVICQSTPIGHFNILDEICVENMDIREFTTKLFKPYLLTHYFGYEVYITGDPSGISRSQTDSNTCFRELASHGLKATPAPTNALQARLSAVNTLLTRPVPARQTKEGDLPWKPALQISPRCKTLIRGFNGGYRMRRLLIQNQERYKDEPEKTKESHPHDALQYAALIYEAAGVRVRTSLRRGGHGSGVAAPPIGAYT